MVQATIQKSNLRRKTPGSHESPISSYSPNAINEDNPSLTTREIMTSPSLCPGNGHAKNSTVSPKVATEFTALQEYLRNEGLHYHPPSLERPTSTNGLEQSLLDFTDVDVLGDDQRFICNHCNNDCSKLQEF